MTVGFCIIYVDILSTTCVISDIFEMTVFLLSSNPIYLIFRFLFSFTEYEFVITVVTEAGEVSSPAIIFTSAGRYQGTEGGASLTHGRGLWDRRS